MTRSLAARWSAATLALVLLPACAEKDGTATDSGAAGPFCRDMADADTTEIDVGGGDPGSGQVIGQLITDDGSDVDDPLIVGQMDYTLENLDVGGPPRAGRTGQTGDFTEEVGAGNWRLSISGTKAGLSCQNQLDIVVEDGNTTRVCIDTKCE
jgi:hypothetical protein